MGHDRGDYRGAGRRFNCRASRRGGRRGRGPPAKTGGVQLKGRDGGGRGSGNLQAIQSQLGSGKPLDSGVRSHMDSAFGYDFSRVRVHTDAAAAGVANNLNARAFTLGKDIAFGAGEYAPGSLIGDALIAHELAHVVQQGDAVSSAAPLPKEQAESYGLEEDADNSAVGAVASLWSGAKDAAANIARNALPRLKSGLRLQRCCDDKRVTVKYRLLATSGFDVCSYCACTQDPKVGADKVLGPGPEKPCPPGREVVWDGTGNCKRSDKSPY